MVVLQFVSKFPMRFTLWRNLFFLHPCYAPQLSSAFPQAHKII